VNNLLEKIWMEEVLAKFKVLCWHMHRVTEKNYKKISVRIAFVPVEI
jgi:hypothetical protein